MSSSYLFKGRFIPWGKIESSILPLLRSALKSKEKLLDTSQVLLYTVNEKIGYLVILVYFKS